MFTCGFIGCGHMGTALASAAAKTIHTGLAVANPTRKKATALAEKTGAVVSDNLTIAAESEFILLGVKPQKLAEVMAEIAPVLRQRETPFVLVTMAAGISIRSLSEMVGVACPIIRIMPNTPVEIGQGMTLFCANALVGEEKITAFLTAFQAAGRFDCLPEALIDAGCAVSGCGPAFVYMFIQALADGGVACGLPRDKAVLYAAQTVAGAGQMVLSSGQHPEALKDAVCSPAGSTIAGVQALETAAFRGSCMEAVKAAFLRTQALGNPDK